MKQMNLIETRTESQQGQSISGASVFEFRLNPIIGLIVPDEVRPKTRGKSPPGRSRSPGGAVALNRIGKAVVRNDHGTRSKTEFYQIKYQKQNQIFINF